MGSARHPRCILCETCVNGLRNSGATLGVQIGCRAAIRPRDMFACDSYVRRFSFAPLPATVNRRLRAS
jgi:hypothetical protein